MATSGAVGAPTPLLMVTVAVVGVLETVVTRTAPLYEVKVLPTWSVASVSLVVPVGVGSSSTVAPSTGLKRSTRTPTGTTSDTDATLHVGSTFTSYSGAVRVTTVSSTPTTATVTINSGVGAPTAPLVAITGNPAALTASATASFSFAGFDTTDAASSLRYLCSRDGATASACTSPVTYTALTSAVHTFTVKVLNLTGNSASATYSWRVDRVAPTLTMTAPATGYALTTSLTPAWSAKDVGGGVANVDLRWARAAYNGGFTSAVYPSTWQKTTATKATLSGAAPGYTYCFSARARDKAGNLSAWSAPDKVALVAVVFCQVLGYTAEVNP